MQKRLSLLLVFFVFMFPVLAVPAELQASQVLVFGGTGRLGSDIVKALVRDGHSVTVFARPSSDRVRLAGLPIAYVDGDVLDGQSVQDALAAQSYSVVVDALGRGSAGVEFYRISAENIAVAAAESGVQQIVLHGSVGAGDSRNAYSNINRFGRMQRLMDAKTAGENAIIASGVDYTIIRNSRLLRYGTKPSGHAELYEDHRLTGSVTRAGLARLTAGCVLNADCFDKIYHAVDKSLSKTRMTN
jgi:uncharacterized protein YbjT (DUF2867 family)